MELRGKAYKVPWYTGKPVIIVEFPGKRHQMFEIAEWEGFGLRVPKPKEVLSLVVTLAIE